MSSTSHNSTAHTLTTKMGPGSGETSLYTGWLVQLMMSGSAFPGFIGGEIKPPGHNSTQWTLIERFRTPEQLSAWRQSDIRRKL